MSTIKVGFIVLAGAVLGRFAEAVIKAVKSGSARTARIYSLGALVLTLVGFLVLKYFSVSVFSYQMDRRYLAVFLSAAPFLPTMWWSGYSIIDGIMSLFIFSGAIAAAIRKDYNFFYFLGIFVLMLFFFYLFFDRYFKPRYCFYVLPIFTVVIAAGVYYILNLALVFRNNFSRVIGLFIAVFFILSIFSYKNTRDALNPILTNPVEKKKYSVRRTGYVNTTGEYHQDMRRVGMFLKRRIMEDDVFITTIFQPILTLGLKIPPEKVFHYNYKSENRVDRVKRIANKHKQGWLILDYRRNGKITKRKFSSKVGKPFKLGRRTMTLLFDRNEAQVFRWR
jgi:hypothetical protein